MLSNRSNSTSIDSDCNYCKKKNNLEKSTRLKSAVTENGFKDLVILPDGMDIGDFILSIDKNTYNLKNKEDKFKHGLSYTRTFDKPIGSINMLSEEEIVVIVGQFK